MTFYKRVRIFCDVLYHLSSWQASAQMLLVQATAYYTNEGWVKTVQVMTGTTGWLDSIIAIWYFLGMQPNTESDTMNSVIVG